MRVVCVILSLAAVSEAGLLDTNVTNKDNLLTKYMKKYLTEKYSNNSEFKLKICTNPFLKKMAKFQEYEKNNEWQPYMPYGIHINFQVSKGYLDAAKDLERIFEKKIDAKVKKALEKYTNYKRRTLGVGCGTHVSNNLPTCYMYLGFKVTTCSIKIQSA